MIFQGGCYCGQIRYEVELQSPEDARTSVCHCKSCKKFFGTGFGLTTKLPQDSFKITLGSTKKHLSDNGTTTLHREFCGACETGILEYGEEAAQHSRYIVTGTLDEPGAVPPRGEFFCKDRETWMPEIPSVFHKREIKE